MSALVNSQLPDNLLLLDIGNSRIKFAVANSGIIGLHGVLQQAEQLSALLAKVELCLLSAVGQQQSLVWIESTLQQQHIPYQYMQTQAELAGLQCAYKEYQRLGVDRWLAMLACKAVCDKDFAVLDFGTAMTCDVVSHQGQHLGGWIAPGIMTMKSGLMQRTEKLSISDTLPETLALGTNTEDCIDFGTIATMQGFLLSAQRYMDNFSRDYQIFVGGGDQHKLTPLLTNTIVPMEHLVFKGMLTVMKHQ